MGSLVALLATWVLWGQLYAEDPVRAVSQHASLEECRKHADMGNQGAAEILDLKTQHGESTHGFFRHPFLCMPQGNVPRPRRQ